MLERHVAEALRRFDANLFAALPLSAPKLRALLHRVPTDTSHVFDLRAFPIATLPFWFSPRCERFDDAAFQTDLIGSSIAGYYAIRLCDNIADNDCPPELRKLAPCTLYFDNAAIGPYYRYFPAEHAFWNAFDALVAQQAEASAADALLEDIDEATFKTISARKFTGAKLPLLAVRFRYDRPGAAYAQWSQFVDSLGEFAQFNNDFFDWRHDSKYKIATYLSCEARRQAPGESLEAWFLKQGFDWGTAELKLRFERARLLGEELCEELLSNWLIARGEKLAGDIAAVKSVLRMTKAFIGVTSGFYSKGGSYGRRREKKIFKAKTEGRDAKDR